MGILLFVVGLLALAAGGLKIRKHAQSVLGGRSPLAIAEVVAGSLTLVGSGFGLARARPAAWVAVVCVLALVAVSSVVHLRRAITRRREREDSEGARLKTYLQSRTGSLNSHHTSG